jgi:hypothetical protein
MEATVKLYTYGYREVRTYVMACLFVLGNVALPQLFHLIPQGGIIWLPIYFFTLVGAYKYGWKVGLLTAIASPLVNSWFFGMPAPAVLPAILTKSLLLAVAAGFVGTEAEWLLSLQGVQGPIGPSPTIFPYDITFSAFEQFAPSMILGATVLARPVLLPKDLASSQAYCDTPPSSTPAKFYLSVDEVIIATLTFTPGNKIGTWSMSADVNINVGQVLRCRSAATADFDTSILGIQLTVVGIADISGV